MNPFWDPLAFSCTATVFLVSGAGHLLHPRRFATAVRRHRLMPAVVAAPVALLVGLCEFALGVAAALALTGAAPGRWTISLLAGAACVCLALGVYLGVLLRTRPHAQSCGCTPWEAPLSALSLVPAMVTGGLAVAALAARGGEPVRSLDAGLLGTLWGLTIAALVLAVPTSVPTLRRA